MLTVYHDQSLSSSILFLVATVDIIWLVWELFGWNGIYVY